MNKKLPRILTLVFALIAVVIAFILYKKVSGEQELQDKIISQEIEIKKKLTLYGELQKLFLLQSPENNKAYAKNWKELKSFVDTGKIYIIDRKETVKELYLGKDTTIFSYDTLKVVAIKDSIWGKSGFNIREFEYVPDDDNARTFVLQTGFSKNRLVFEIKDPEPINPARQIGELDTLRVGSMTEPTTEGNW
jgi:hypothetical protein